MARCKSCDAPIVWLVTASGKVVPVDLATADPQVDRKFDPAKHRSHFATCPHATKHRKEPTP